MLQPEVKALVFGARCHDADGWIGMDWDGVGWGGVECGVSGWTDGWMDGWMDIL